jgi:hypothetical protein
LRKLIINSLKYSLLWLWLMVIPGSLLGDAGLRFYFFSPDSPQNNLGRLKSDMESLLEGLDVSIEFQPFARLTDFDLQVREDRPAFVFAPHWYLRRYAGEIGFIPMLQSLREAQNSYRKLLVGRRNGHSGIKQPERMTLAMTSLGPGSKAVLRGLLKKNSVPNLDELSIVEVPKDADAIFAAALGQVDVALVSQANLKLFQTINPKLVDSLEVFSESTPVDMPVLGYIEGSVSEEQKEDLKHFMLSSQESTVMRTLQIEGWARHDR